MALARDGCVVPTEPLADLLNGFASRWRRQRPVTAGQFAQRQQRTEVTFVGPVDWLSAETQRLAVEGGHPVSAEAITRILRRRSRVTELRTADALVAALGCPEVFHDGTLEIQPNPLASSRERAACCGSGASDSLTGCMTPGFWDSLAAYVRPNLAA